MVLIPTQPPFPFPAPPCQPPSLPHLHPPLCFCEAPAGGKGERGGQAWVSCSAAAAAATTPRGARGRGHGGGCSAAATPTPHGVLRSHPRPGARPPAHPLIPPPPHPTPHPAFCSVQAIGISIWATSQSSGNPDAHKIRMGSLVTLVGLGVQVGWGWVGCVVWWGGVGWGGVGWGGVGWAWTCRWGGVPGAEPVSLPPLLPPCLRRAHLLCGLTFAPLPLPALLTSS